MCSCGFSYIINKGILQNKNIKCPICNEKIGGKRQLVRREGHVRIFYDEKSKQDILNYSYSDKNIPNKLLNELEKEIDNEKKELLKGFKPLKQQSEPEYLCQELLYIQNYINTNKVKILNENSDRLLFKKYQEKIREMNNISYRILNLIFYSFLFYSNIQNYINDKNLNKYVIQSMTCFDIIEENWNLIQESLGKIDIKLFLNVIFDEITNKLISCPNLKTKDQTINFEKEINEIINKKISDEKLINEYNERNYNLININPKAIKSIIQEIYSPNKYPEYPEMKYFYLSEFPSKENFISKFNDINKEKYPLLNIIVNEDEFNKNLIM